MMPSQIQEILKDSGRPDRAGYDWQAFEQAYAAQIGELPSGHPHLSGLARVFGRSLFLGQRLSQHPEWAQSLLDSAFVTQEKTAARFYEELESAVQPVQEDLSLVARVLRHYRYEETLRFTVRELAPEAEFQVLGRERSALAAACLQVATQVLMKKLVKEYGQPIDVSSGEASRFCVLGMGKLGGDDLNCSSDIDLIYLYSSDTGAFEQAPDENEVNHHQFFVRLGEMLAKLLSERTEDGFVYRVDLDLRPEGRKGTLANAIDAMEDYYESFGDNWERMALVKARPIAGDLVLGDRFCRRVRSFVYPGIADLETLRQLKDLKEKIERSVQNKLIGSANAEKADYNVKLGKGGIRDIEFIVGAFQRLYGGQNPELRVRSTLGALKRLATHKLIQEVDADDLSKAYRFLRCTENRLQMSEDRQVHTLPTSMEEIAALTHDFGGPDLFREQLLHHTERVHALWNQFLENR